MPPLWLCLLLGMPHLRLSLQNTVLLIIPLNCPLNFCQIASAQPARLSTSEYWLTLSLLNLRISEPLEVNMLKPVRTNFRTLSRICVKADPWAIPTCRVLQGTVSSNSITLVYIYTMPDGIRIPTLQQHFIDAQDQTPLPIWRPEAYFKYPDGGDLETEEIFPFIGTLQIVSSRKKSSPRCCQAH